MGNTSLTMPDMATKKKKPGRPATGRKPAYVISSRISPKVGAALDAYIAASRPRPTQTSVLETALERFLEGAGFWPPGDDRPAE